jgi:hypothetical protein
MVAGVNLSFVAEQDLADRVKEAARIDGVSQSQAAARAAALGVLLSAAARRNVRFALEQGGAAARQDLSLAVSRAVTQVADAVIKRQLREKALVSAAAPPTEEEILDEAVGAVDRNTRRQDAIQDTEAESSRARRSKIGAADRS